MDKNIIRQIYIDFLSVYVTEVQTASIENDKFQDEIIKFKDNPEYRLKLNAHTIHVLDIVCKRENLTLFEARWLRDTWLY